MRAGILIFWCLCFVPLPAVHAAEDAGATQLAIDLREQGRPFRGWGTSLAWWAYGVGGWADQPLDRLVRLIVDPHDGLGLNVFRYNIGGGDAPGHHHMGHWRDMPGVKASADAAYDWDADAAQRRVLLKLLAAVRAGGGQPIVEGFSNSAPWWMTISGCAAGAADGGANLRGDCEAPFADYLADVVRYFRDQQGVTFDSLEPLNEPDARWWVAGKRQEGMHIGRDQQARLIRLTRDALNARGLLQTRVSATDANRMDDCLASLLSFDSATLAALGQVNTHTYSGSKRLELRRAAEERGKPLWQSESGPLHVHGTEDQQVMTMARRIVRDINQLRPEVWCTWQIIDHGAWGCLHEEPGREKLGVGKMFHVLAAFTRGVRPGDRFVRLDSDRVLASVSPQRGEVTLMLVNTDAQPRAFRLDLRGAKTLPAAAGGICVSGGAEAVPAKPATIRAGTLETIVPADSVTRLTLRASAE